MWLRHRNRHLGRRKKGRLADDGGVEIAALAEVGEAAGGVCGRNAGEEAAGGLWVEQEWKTVKFGGGFNIRDRPFAAQVIDSIAPSRTGTSESRTAIETFDAFAISSACPSNPKPVTSVHAVAPWR
jgi:hypothetical protein